jgi:hypothetical protein
LDLFPASMLDSARDLSRSREIGVLNGSDFLIDLKSLSLVRKTSLLHQFFLPFVALTHHEQRTIVPLAPQLTRAFVPRNATTIGFDPAVLLARGASRDTGIQGDWETHCEALYGRHGVFGGCASQDDGSHPGRGSLRGQDGDHKVSPRANPEGANQSRCSKCWRARTTESKSLGR